MFRWFRKLWSALFGARVDDIPDSIPTPAEEKPAAQPSPPPPRPSVYASAVSRIVGSLSASMSRVHYSDIATLRAAAQELEEESVLTLQNARVVTVFLEKLWEGDRAFLVAARARAHGKGAQVSEEWRIGLCEVFLKQLEGAEQSFKGRILQAIRKLANSPGASAGRLAEPLGPDDGPWMLPIGNARLLYLVDEKTRVVFLLAYT